MVSNARVCGTLHGSMCVAQWQDSNWISSKSQPFWLSLAHYGTFRPALHLAGLRASRAISVELPTPTACRARGPSLPGPSNVPDISASPANRRKQKRYQWKAQVHFPRGKQVDQFFVLSQGVADKRFRILGPGAGKP